MTSWERHPVGVRHTLSRRSLVQAGATGLGVAALGIAGVDPGITAGQTGESFTATGPETVAGLAARLGYDIASIFAFVRDEIRYETYAGVLRGARGTFWARAGNSADQALLLAELLKISQVRFRFAAGPLDPDHESSLIALLSPTLDEARGQFQALVTTWGEILSGDNVEPLTADDEALLEQIQVSAERAIALGIATTEIVHRMVRDALSGADISLPDPPATALAERERHQHTWIQVPDGGAWLDLDPTISGREISPSGSTPEATFDALPDEWRHQVTYRIVAEELSQGSLVRRDAVTFTRAAPDIFDVPVALSLVSGQPPGVAGTVGQLYSDQIAVFPSFHAGGEVTGADQPMVFARDGASPLSVFDSLGGDEPVAGALAGETIAAWLVVDIVSPDAAPVTIERALLDRVPSGDRLSGTFDPVKIPPVPTVPDELFEELVAGFSGMTVLHVDVGRIPSMYALARGQNEITFGEMGLLGPSLGFLRDGIGVAEEGAAGYWSYPSVPNVTAITVTPAPPNAEDSRTRLAADLIYRHRTTLPLTGVDPVPGVHPQMLSGILDTVAERLLLAPETRSTGDAAAAASIAETPSIGAVFMQADEDDVGILVLQSTADLLLVEIGPATGALMTQSLEAGAILVAPAQPVEADGATLYGWWVVDPATGHTFDQFPDGRGSGSILVGGQFAHVFAQNLPERSELEKQIDELTNCVGYSIVMLVGAVAISYGIYLNNGPTAREWLASVALYGAAMRGQKIFAGGCGI